MKTALYGLLTGLLITSFANGQSKSSAVPYSKIYAHCLNADVRSALSLVSPSKADTLNQNDIRFITEFESRFSHNTDTSSFLKKRASPIDEVLKIYRNYWRTSLLDPSGNYDSVLLKDLSAILFAEYKYQQSGSGFLNEDTIDHYLKKYVQSRGLHTTGYGKTGKLLDLLVWRSETDTVFDFSVHGESITSKVIFMDDFITLGWEEYATIDRYYPGGWATKEALFCVKKAYDLKSENFLISYLCHEGRHFSDYKMFPKLSSADLEYRAKLTELSLLK